MILRAFSFSNTRILEGNTFCHFDCIGRICLQCRFQVFERADFHCSLIAGKRTSLRFFLCQHSILFFVSLFLGCILRFCLFLIGFFVFILRYCIRILVCIFFCSLVRTLLFGSPVRFFAGILFRFLTGIFSGIFSTRFLFFFSPGILIFSVVCRLCCCRHHRLLRQNCNRLLCQQQKRQQNTDASYKCFTSWFSFLHILLLPCKKINSRFPTAAFSCTLS